jgi:hypothetical protein
MTQAANDIDGPAPEPKDADEPKDIAIIREQTFESLQILRNLLSLLMPKEEDDDGPKLVDLIAALVAQQRDILVGIKSLQADNNALFDCLDAQAGRLPHREMPG